MSGTISSFAQFETKISVIIVKMCLTFPIMTKCAWEPGSRFPLCGGLTPPLLCINRVKIWLILTEIVHLVIFSDVREDLRPYIPRLLHSGGTGP